MIILPHKIHDVDGFHAALSPFCFFRALAFIVSHRMHRGKAHTDGFSLRFISFTRERATQTYFANSRYSPCFPYAVIFKAKTKDTHESECLSIWRRHPDSNWRMKLLQSFALPLGHGAEFGAVDEIRTRDIHLGKVALYH